MSRKKGCPSCAAYAATWLTDCENPVHMAQANAYMRELEARLAALPPAMTWTREKPEKPGWYWWRLVNNPLCQVVEWNGYDADGRECEWAGPIAPPMEPPQ